jgi:hypothetical protein
MESSHKSAMSVGVAGKVRVVTQLGCVVYDEKDGTVVHGHGAVYLEGGEVPDEAAFQKRALELARKSRDLGSRRLKTMMVELSAMSGGPMRVDIGSHRLIPDESPPPARRRAGHKGGGEKGKGKAK